MTSTGNLFWYLEWVKNFRIAVDSECGASAVRYINIHVECTPWPVGHWGVPFRTYIL